MTEDLFGQRLSTALKTLSSKAIPDEIRCVAELLDWDPLADDLSSFPSVTVTVAPRRSMHARRGARGLTAVVLALGMGGLGAGIAAAAGVITQFGHHPTAREAYTESVGTRLVAPARGTLSPTGHWTATNVRTRLTVPGPDRSTISLQTSSSDAHDGCLHLLVTTPTRPSGPGVVTCSEQYTATHPTTTSTPSTTFGSGYQTWISPTGDGYLVLFGQAPSGAVSAKLVNGQTGAVITGNEPISGGFYADPVPQKVLNKHDELVFYDATGNRVGRSAL